MRDRLKQEYLTVRGRGRRMADKQADVDLSAYDDEPTEDSGKVRNNLLYPVLRTTTP